MRRAAPLAVLIAIALLAGTARADTFAILPEASAPSMLPTLSPNVDGSVGVPFDLSTPPTAPLQLSYPELLGLWQRAGSAYGIQWQVLASINKVESNFGRNMGPSSAGAIGWMQFMPSTWLRWGTDANGDGIADPWNPDDAIFSAARYLAAAGGASDIYRAVFAYNHADWYVQEVLGLAQVYGADTTAAFSLDRLQVSLDAARASVVAANERLVAAQTSLRAASRVASRWQSRAARTQLLSDRLAVEQQAGVVAATQSQIARRVATLQQGLVDAQAALAKARQESAAASFNPAASQLLGAPSYSAGYVFPVGGGPGLVFASHSHHDYPAVDIAAPMGSPLYALADSIVERAWTTPDSRCGIGFTLRAFDGQVWTYCHLSVLGSNVVPGATLTAGEEVGLVGDTGHATGPHLHLQLQPALEWPQQEAWFLSFADKAFTWSDTGANDADDALRTTASVSPPQPTNAPVFAVLPDSSPTAASDAAPSNGVVYFSRAGS